MRTQARGKKRGERGGGAQSSTWRRPTTNRGWPGGTAGREGVGRWERKKTSQHRLVNNLGRLGAANLTTGTCGGGHDDPTGATPADSGATTAAMQRRVGPAATAGGHPTWCVGCGGGSGGGCGGGVPRPPPRRGPATPYYRRHLYGIGCNVGDPLAAVRGKGGEEPR